MKIRLTRLFQRARATIGALFVNEVFYCYTCEDGFHYEKIPGQTRISAGIYEIGIRQGSPMANRYDKQFAAAGHSGMLWIKDVPNFEYVYLHIGNDADDTDGCILVGTSAGSSTVSHSTNAYHYIYKKIRQAISSEFVIIQVEDER